MNHLRNLESNVQEICEGCNNSGAQKCNFRNCNIGFVDYVIGDMKKNDIYAIEDGDQLITKYDMQYYDEEIIAQAIANTCRMCKECSDDHSENCVVALLRRSLEYTQLKEKIVYPGNILLYLMNLATQKPEFAELVKREYISMA